LLLARADDLLSANPKHRPLYTQMESEWELLRQAEQVLRAHAAGPVIATRQ